MAPIDVLNYIVVHELTHLIHPNHTTAFWNELDKVLPNYEKQIQWLKINGAGMDL
jgi:predicted metal-dependent hydrolase